MRGKPRQRLKFGNIMETKDKNELKRKIDKVLESCKNTPWEKETVKKVRLKLKNELGMRDILIDKYLA